MYTLCDEGFGNCITRNYSADIATRYLYGEITTRFFYAEKQKKSSAKNSSCTKKFCRACDYPPTLTIISTLDGGRHF